MNGARRGLKTVFVLIAFGRFSSAQIPDIDWNRTSTGQTRKLVSDCFGTSYNPTPNPPSPCQSYATDLYENWDPASDGSSDTDLQALRVGFDASFIYVEVEAAATWNYDSTGSARGYLIEIDHDRVAEGTPAARRPDFLFSWQLQSGHVGTTWVAEGNAKFKGYYDDNDDVGGSTPLGPDFPCNPPCNGYEDDVPLGLTDAYLRVITRGGKRIVQCALRASVLGAPTGSVWMNPWTSQSSTIDKSKLRFHDMNAPTDLATNLVDNALTANVGEWLEIGPESPIVNPVLLDGDTTITGSSVEAPGSVVSVYVDGVLLGTTTVQADGSWMLTGLAVPLAAGQVIDATVTVPALGTSALSNQVVVAASPANVTPAPAVMAPCQGATSVSGTSAPSAIIEVFLDGIYVGRTASDLNGNWSLLDVSVLDAGAIVSATATLPPAGTSVFSDPIVVSSSGCTVAVVHLLRNDATVVLPPAPSIFVRTHPSDPALDTLGTNNVADFGEGLLTASPGSSDDDDAYVRNIASGSLDPDGTVLGDGGRILVFYELNDNQTKTLFLQKSGTGILITYQP